MNISRLLLSVLVLWMIPIIGLWAAVDCPSCGHINSDDTRYCLSCAFEVNRPSPRATQARSAALDTVPDREPSPIPRGPFIVIAAVFILAFLMSLVASISSKRKQRAVVTDLDKTRMFLSVQADGLPGAMGRGPVPRRFDRIPAKIPVMCHNERGDEFKALVCDLSLGGLGIVTKETVEKGDRIKVYFQLKDGGTIKITGTAVFITRMSDASVRAGLQFYHLFSEQEKFIEQLIARQTK